MGNTNKELKPKRIVAVGKKYKVGNCQDCAGATYYFLRRILGSEYKISIINNKSPHFYCIISPANELISVKNIPPKSIVVDPWIEQYNIFIKQPMTALWINSSHTFYYSPDKIMFSKTGKSESVFDSKTAVMECLLSLLKSLVVENLPEMNFENIPKFALKSYTKENLKKREFMKGKKIWDDGFIYNPYTLILRNIQSNPFIPKVTHGMNANLLSRPYRDFINMINLN